MFKYKNKIFKAVLFLIIGCVIFMCFNCSIFKKCDVMNTKTYINSFGMMAPVVYIIMFTLVPLTLFPDSILAVSGGMVFGVFYGTIYTIIGALFGATLSFFIARFLGRGIVNKLVHNKGKWFEDGVEKRGFLIILALRLIPLVPFDIISYGAGLSKIKFKDFFAASAVGIIPGVIVFTNLGDKSLKVTSPEFIAALGMLILLLLISYFMKKKISLNKLQEKYNRKEVELNEDKEKYIV